VNASDILHGSLLIVDDQEVNVVLLERMLRGAGYVSIASTTDPREVCDLHVRNHYDLILLDLQMPGMDGFQVMEGLKEAEPDGYLPVLVITAQPGHKLRALQAGAKDFIAKPFELAEVLARVRNLLEVRLLHKALHEYSQVLEQRVRERTADLRESHLEMLFTMTRAAEHRDEDTGAHVKRIGYYSQALARILGRDEEYVDRIFFASPMHDIGKIGVPDHVLLKPGGFTPEEWEVMKGHTLMGAKILGNSKSPYLRMGAEIALNHHERWDGRGYPNGRRGEAIPEPARIMNICDVYDALRSKRPYKPSFDHRKAVDVISLGDGRTQPGHFDPVIFKAFRENHPAFRDIFEAYAT
jgi:putative two-component system response regulator